MNTLIKTLLFSPDEIKPNRNETMRYLGVKGEPDPQLVTLLDACEKELAAAAAYWVVYTYLPLTRRADDTLLFGAYEVKSHALSKNLADCDSVCLFAATVGIGADRLIAKYGRVSPARSAVIDSAASSAIEALCDAFNGRVGEEYDTCPRFSPGYGDFPLAAQKELLSILDASRKIGVFITEALMMTPTNSVTAVIGIRGKRAQLQNGD